MGKIDTTMWKDFKIANIFETEFKGNVIQVPTGASIEKQNLVDGTTPRITVAGFNNGIYGRFDCNIETNNYRLYENFISVSFLKTVFYHPYKASLDMKVHCLKPKDIELNKYIGQFLVTVIKTSLKNSSYADQLSSTVLPYMNIKLPTTESGEPDWRYMEKYAQDIEKKATLSLNKLKTINQIKKNKVDISKWKPFHLYDLFTIDAGTKLDKVKMKTDSPSINFVGRSSVNKGITEKINIIDNIEPYQRGCLTLALGGAYLGACFIQDEPFYTSQNVNVLVPIRPMSEEAKLFIATTIFVESQLNYKAFIRELNKHVKTDFTIYLPAKSEKEPDLQFMEKYMKNILRTKYNDIHNLKAYT